MSETNDCPAILARVFQQHGAKPEGLASLGVFQWNVLAQGLGFDSFIRAPKRALDWEFRKYRTTEMLLEHNPQVICLQELNEFDFVLAQLRPHGYQGVFHQKPKSPCLQFGAKPDGCALFWRTESLELLGHELLVLEADDKPCNQVSILARFAWGDKRIGIVTTHLKSKPTFEGLRAKQVAFVLEHVKTMQERHQLDGVVFTGDFNTEPNGEAVPLVVSQGFGSAFEYDYGRHTTWKVRPDPHGEIKHHIDYIFFSKAFQVSRTLRLPADGDVPESRFPHESNPSDHLPLFAEFFIARDS